MPDPSEGKRVPIEYGVAPSRGRRRWVRGVVLIVFVAGGVLLWRYGRPLMEHFETRLAVRRCVNWEAPADTVVFECAKAAQAELLHQPGAQYRPAEFGGVVRESPECWKTVKVLLQNDGDDRNVIFMHARRSKGGHERLVVVTLHAWDMFNYHTVDPGGVTDVPRLVRSEPVVFDELAEVLLNNGGDFDNSPTWYAGQVDLNDGSHFTVDWMVDGRREVLDGYLEDDDRVRMSVRNLRQAAAWIIPGGMHTLQNELRGRGGAIAKVE